MFCTSHFFHHATPYSQLPEVRVIMSASFPMNDLNPRSLFESLCQKCQGFSLAFKTSWYSSNVDGERHPFNHHEDFLSLQASGDAGCALCQLIRQYIVWDCQLSEPLQNLLLTEWRYEGTCIRFQVETTCPSSNILQFYESGLPDDIPDLGIKFLPNSSYDIGIPTLELIPEYLEEMKTISIKGMK